MVDTQIKKTNATKMGLSSAKGLRVSGFLVARGRGFGVRGESLRAVAGLVIRQRNCHAYAPIHVFRH